MTPYEVGYYCQWMGLDWEISNPYDRGCDESTEFQLGTIGAVFDNNAFEYLEYEMGWNAFAHKQKFDDKRTPNWIEGYKAAQEFFTIEAISDTGEITYNNAHDEFDEII